MTEMPHVSADAPPSRRQRRSERATSETDKSQPKGGRNLWAATAVGAAMLLVVGGSLFLYLPLFGVVVAALIVVSLIEFRHAIRDTGRHMAMPLIIVGGVGIFICAWKIGLEAMLTATLLTVAAALLWHLIGAYEGKDALRNVAFSAFAVGYIPFLASFVALLAVECGPEAVAVFILSVTLGSDTGGYFMGRFLGRHHMAPTISPHKTWEGLFGSILGATLLCVAGTFWLQISWYYGIFLGVMLALTGTVGDLSESMLKRDLGIKDMGHLLPGHGGFLDRLDSLLMGAPVAYVILKYALWISQPPIFS